MLSITGLYASLFAFLILWLASRVVKLRVTHKVGLLDDGHHDLLSAIRIHGNAVEYIPIALILLACAESQHLSKFILHGFGVTLIIARILHITGLMQSKGRSFGRFYGTALTWLVIIGLGVSNLYAFVRHG